MSISVTVKGHIGKAAEVRFTKSGAAVTSFPIACTLREKRGGEWVDGETVWFAVTYWGELPTIILDRGVGVTVIGDLSKRSYEKDGDKRESLEIKAQNIAITVKPATVTTNKFDNQPSAAPVIDDMPF
jgi:single-strand DNA-binding protein